MSDPNIEDLYPLSPCQQGMLFHTLYAPKSGVYLRQVRWGLGELNVPAFKRSWQAVIDRHPALRASFHWDRGGKPFQIVRRQANARWDEQDWRELPSSEQQARLEAYLQADRERGFELSTAPLIRMALIRMANETHEFIWSHHHLLLDGWTLPLLLSEVFTFYDAFCESREVEIPRPRPFRDYIAWLQKQDLSKAESYWRRVLKGFESPVVLSIDRAPAVAFDEQSDQGLQQIRFTKELTTALKAIGRQHQLTLNTIVQGSWAILLSRYSGQKDVVFGSVVSGRPGGLDGVEGMVGPFINTLPVRVEVREEQPVIESLKQLQAEQAEAREYEYSPLAQVQKWSDVQRGKPLFETMLVFENYPVTTSIRESAGRLKFLRSNYSEKANYPLAFIAMTGAEMVLLIAHDKRRFETDEIRKMLNHLQSLLQSMAEDINQPISALPPHFDLASSGSQSIDEQREAFDIYDHSNLTRHQLLMWAGQKLQPEVALYNMTHIFTINRPVELERFRRAFCDVVSSSDALRTIVEEREGVPQQSVLDSLQYEVECFDLSNNPDPAAAVRNWVGRRCQIPLDLRQRLFDSALLKMSEDRFAWYLNIHHMIADAWSHSLIFRRVASLYQKSLKGEVQETFVLPAFMDYVEFEREYRRSQQYVDDQAYWKRKIAGDLEPINFYGSTIKRGSRVVRIAYDLGAERSRRLKETARQEGIFQKTLQVTLLNTFAALLFTYIHRVSGNRTISIGVPFHNRQSEAFKETIGLFMQVSPIRVDVDEDETLLSLIQKTAAEASEAMKHKQYAVQNPAKSKVFDVILNYHTAFYPEFNGASVSTEWFHSGHDDISLALQVHDFGLSGNLTLYFDLHCDIFSEAQRGRFIDNFIQVIDGFLENQYQRVDSIDLLSPEEKHRILVEFNQTRAAFPKDQTFSQLFESQVLSTPNNIACSFEGTSLTYAEVNARANRLAHYLKREGAGPDRLVALMMPRSLEFLTCVLAVFKAGAAYLPIDPLYPLHRVRLILDDAEPLLVLTQSELLDGLSELARYRILAVDSLSGEIGSELAPNPATSAASENLAYVIYTSGSTGKPKGVMIEQRGMVNHLHAKIADLSLTSADTIAQTASQCFDISVWQMLAGLIVGARTQVIGDDAARDPNSLISEIHGSSVTVAETVPSMLRALIGSLTEDQGQADKVMSELKWLLVTGEALPAELCRQWLRIRPDVKMVNAYGPTECSDDVTHEVIEAPPVEQETYAAIGLPVANTQIYIVDKKQNLVPMGVTGEICVGGEGVGRGYVKDGAKTAEVYVPDNLSGKAGARLYRTGDMGRLNDDGKIQYLGRVDDQVKVRGHRIELEEVEAALKEQQGVREAVVMAREEGEEKRLVGYVVAERGVNATEMRVKLRAKLPEYMVPAWIVKLDAMPLTANGKVDRKKLPAPEGERAELQQQYQAPATTVERELARIWSEVLGVKQVSVSDNFFELGGDSILSIQIIARARKVGIIINPRQMFQYQTIAEVAKEAGTRSNNRAEQGLVIGWMELTPIQAWFFEQRFEHPDHWNQSVLLEVEEDAKEDDLREAFEAVIRQHDALRMRIREQDGRRKAEIVDVDVNAAFRRVQVTLDQEEREEATSYTKNKEVAREKQEAQKSLIIQAGPMCRAIYFDYGPRRKGRLLIVGHHLVVDNVSWELILETLSKVYLQRKSGEDIRLEEKSSSYKEWSRKLREYCVGEEMKGQIESWTGEQRERVKGIPVDKTGGRNTEGSARNVVVSMSEKQTRALLQDVPKAYRTMINDVLLTALMEAYREWSGEEEMLVDVEGHGREDIFDGIDVTRTVGWFTAISPMLLHVTGVRGIGERLKRVKEQVRAVKNGGIGYGLLRYLGNEEVRNRLKRQPGAEMVFNYMGRTEAAASTQANLFKRVPEPRGIERSLDDKRAALIEINGSIVEGRLRVVWTYSEEVHERETIERLANEFIKGLSRIIEHCESPEAVGFTPSDFPKAKLNQPDLDRLIAGISQATARQSE